MPEKRKKDLLLRDFHHLFATGNIVGAIPVDPKLSSYLYTAMKCIAGVKTCTICLYTQIEPYGDPLDKPCSNCRFFSDQINCKNKSEGDYLVFPLATYTTVYASISIKVNEDFSEELVPAIQNLANITAITIENNLQKESLQKKNNELKNYQQVLENKVLERTQELDKSNKELSKTVEILNEAQQIVNIGHWEMDLITEDVFWSDEVYRIFELAPKEFKPTFHSFLDKIFPEDRESVERTFSDAISKKKSYNIEHRINCKGGIKYVQENGKIYFDEQGNPVRAIGMVLDVSERKKNEKIIQESSARLEEQNKVYEKLNEELLAKNKEYEILVKKLQDANTQINSINADLIVSRNKAQESDQLKTAFLHNMSHEIRTPMNAIIGFSELLPGNLSNRQKAESFVKIIIQRCNDLLVIVDDILDLSKIESGQLPVNFEVCDIRSFFDDLKLVFSEKRMKAGKKNIQFHVTISDSLRELSIITDKVKLKQIFFNLIGNAFKFTEQGRIEAGCREDNEHGIIFFVRDTGRGIQKGKQDIIFSPFIQLEMEDSRLLGGTGLGLSIVKGLVSLLEGKIWIDSEPGKGSDFSFFINYRHNVAVDFPETKPGLQESAGFGNKTVLIVEDDEYNKILINEILLDTGLRLLFAMNGTDAIKIATSENPDLILMDISLPDISGYEVVKTILKRNPSAKIIAQTAFAAAYDREKAIDSGCLDHISKPLKPESLIEKVRKNLLQSA